MDAEPRTYAQAIAMGVDASPRRPLWHPTRWLAAAMLVVDVLTHRHAIRVHAPTAWTDDTNEPYGTAYTSADDVSDDEAAEIRKTDQARAIALAEATALGG